MGVQVGSGDKKAVDVNINVVPFIDLMSCLTAFLLVTAVWTQFAQINIKPKGLGREATKLQEENKVFASILVSESEIWVGTTADVPIRIGKLGEKQDWSGLRKVLDGYRQDPVFEGRADIEVAADDRVIYQDVITAMDTAIAAQFRDIGFIDPQSLSVRFKE
ncbi:MAG TPA: biopolymer transporter ExbD [Kofleriaceae bacterium]|nr:biopolymer transporter ExbD [Kofleriaceae bacterium]